MKLRAICFIFAGSALVISLSAFAQLPRVIDPAKSSLEDLAGSDTYVTVVLSGAHDRDLRIVDVGKTVITFIKDDGTYTPYLINQIREIRVQDRRIGGQTRSYLSAGILTADDQATIERAAQRAYEIVDTEKSDQNATMKASSLLAASRNQYGGDALRHLQQLASGNDPDIAIDAATYLALAGAPVEPALVRNGMSSGNRATKVAATRLAGLLGEQTYGRAVSGLLQDPVAEIYSPAARAAAYTNPPNALPQLLRGLRSLSEEKADSAVYGLSRLGGREAVQELLDLLEARRSSHRFRALKVLYRLDDSKATELMKTEAFASPATKREAAILLAADEDWDAIVWLRDTLNAPMDLNRSNLNFRARAAAVLLDQGLLEFKTELQRLLQMSPDEVWERDRTSDQQWKEDTVSLTQQAVLRELARLGTRDLISLAKPSVESGRPYVALTAIDAVTAISNSEYRDRILRYWGLMGLME